MNCQIPDQIVDCIEIGTATCVKINSHGTILAVGCVNGKVLLYDWQIKGPLRTLWAHTQLICGLSWNGASTLLATASRDSSLLVWRVPDCTVVYRLTSKAPINSVCFSRNNDLLLVCTRDKVVCVANLNSGQPKVTDWTARFDEDADAAPLSKGVCDFIGAFLADGVHFVVGVNTGTVFLCRENIEASAKLSTGPVNYLTTHPNAPQFLFNATDWMVKCAIVKIDDAGKASIDVSAVKFVDSVARTKWKSAFFSQEGFYVITVAASKTHSNVFVWNSDDGRYLKSLEGPKEPIVQFEMLPTNFDYLTLTSFGNIYVSADKVDDDWSAFAPNFTAIDENIIYDEAENEFDIDPATNEPVIASIHMQNHPSPITAAAQHPDVDEEDIFVEQSAQSSVEDGAVRLPLGSLSDDEADASFSAAANGKLFEACVTTAV